MFNSTTLEVAIGLAFCYASVSLIVSSINEGISSLLKLRANLLLTGIKSLLNDPNFEGLALNIYNHGLVGHADQGDANAEQDLKNKPSYIDPKHFAVALIDTVQTIPGDLVQLKNDIDAIQDPQLRTLLQGIYGRASGNIDKIHSDVAAWFDAGMNRLSGKYKRRIQLNCFLIALFIAVLFNVDSFYLFKTLWQHPAIVAGIDAPEHPEQISWQQFMALPIGWQGDTVSISFTQVVGWLVTASATLFGAPFWFDVLQKFVRLRGAGSKPGEANK